jgi:hypothetical protein
MLYISQRKQQDIGHDVHYVALTSTLQTLMSPICLLDFIAQPVYVLQVKILFQTLMSSTCPLDGLASSIALQADSDNDLREPPFLGYFSLLNTVVLPFVTDKIDHWNTGEARVWQHDFNVGHGAGASHFLTQCYQGHVLVIEVSSDHTAHAYVVPVQFVTPPRITPIVTLQMQDLNGDQEPDLLVWAEGIASPIPLYNNGQTFQADDPTKKG